MKKLFLLFTFATIAFNYSNAQSESGLKPFKVDVSLGYAIPGGKGAKGGILIAVEPKYSVISNLAVGIRFEGAVIARFGGFDADGNSTEQDVKASASYLATADYYFGDNYAVRPFIGAGAGIYSLAGAQLTSSTSTITAETSKFGGMIRGGLELRHFRLGFEYNLVPKTKFEGYNMNGDPATLSANGYMGIKIGFCIGGGPR